MAKIKFLSKWILEYQQTLMNAQKKLNLPRGLLLLVYDAKYRKAIGRFLMKLNKWEEKNSDTREISVTMEISYRDRTLDQNALMWALYEIEAKEMNGGMVGTPDQMVNKEDLYDADLESWGERDTVITTISRVNYYLCNYRIVRYECVGGGYIRVKQEERKKLMTLTPETEITLQITRGTSQYNTVEMARHIEGIFNRLAVTVGINDTGDLAMYKDNFDKFKMSLQKGKNNEEKH